MPGPSYEAVEAGNEAGRAAWLSMLSLCLQRLGYERWPEMDRAWLIAERERTRVVLRRLCGEFGDRDWGATTPLDEVVADHLAKHLDARSGRARR